MACPSSGTITIQDIVDEFGGSAPHSLSEYYRDGGEVPSNNTNVIPYVSTNFKISSITICSIYKSQNKFF